MSGGPAALLLGDAVLLRGAAVFDVYRAVSSPLRAARLNGSPPPARLLELQQVLANAVAAVRASAAGQDDVRTEGTGGEWEPAAAQTLSAPAAALVLGMSPRQVQRIARSLDGRKVGGTWVLDAAAVHAYAAARDQLDHDRPHLAA